MLAVDNSMVATTFQTQLAERAANFSFADVTKIVGCWNGLAKRGHAEHDFGADPEPMRRAVAFAGTINASKKVEGMFEVVVDQFVAVHGGEEDERGPAWTVRSDTWTARLTRWSATPSSTGSAPKCRTVAAAS